MGLRYINILIELWENIPKGNNTKMNGNGFLFRCIIRVTPGLLSPLGLSTPTHRQKLPHYSSRTPCNKHNDKTNKQTSIYNYIFGVCFCFSFSSIFLICTLLNFYIFLMEVPKQNTLKTGFFQVRKKKYVM